MKNKHLLYYLFATACVMSFSYGIFTYGRTGYLFLVCLALIFFAKPDEDKI